MKRRLINVSNRLPVTIGDTITKSSGGLVKAMEGVADDLDLRWIGWSGGPVQSPQRRQALTDQLQDEFGYVPVFREEEDVEAYYNGFSNASLWPLLHYLPEYSRFEEPWFAAYQRVNEAFAEVVLSAYEGEDDVVWVHDYHLLLLPQMLRAACPQMNIGFFLHTPFPSYEIFRCHPKRTELIQGLLGADLLGFHTYGYLRHFRSTVMRLLGIDAEMNMIPHDNRGTVLGVYPIGINARDFLQEMESEAFAQCTEEYREAYADKKIVLNVERLDYTKGIPRKLQAIERFLESYPDPDQIVFIFICVPSREGVKEYQDLLEQVEWQVGQINGRFATITNIPIHFIHRTVSFPQLCALYTLADVALVTPLMDGMNLVAKEYLVCQQDCRGVLILSEFAGAAQELSSALIVNPYDVLQVVESINKALALSPDEKQRMIEPMRQRVIRYDARYWANTFVQDLAETGADEVAPEVAQTMDLSVLEPYIHSRRVGFFLDYDGTLSELRKTPDEALPLGDIQTLLQRLGRNEIVDVYLISGRKCEDMDAWFSSYGITLIAEHGYYYRKPDQRAWSALEPTVDITWKEQIIEMFQSYAGTTPGSFVEEKTASVVWHYRRTDPEFGTWKAHQLLGELYEMASNLPVQVNHGKKIVEVNSSQINKGIALEKFVHWNRYEMALCAGDDVTDENMFTAGGINNLISIKIGKGETHARYRIADPDQFRRFMLTALQLFSESGRGAQATR